ncbi:hypothetical protein KC318_g4435 [Hortaea werneckii]|nr:hypothetical protein KC334_g8573 [Hortaea werneckii]KAI7014861.1 hypothetical protein KC355_g4531 [Hortaea werneckii]KAI7669784.1 hypothetical protein KC318_g4435 [Hortaea werneckii]
MSTDVPPPAAPAADAVVNDFYNKDDYVRRRADFLGNHDDYKDILVFPIARDDAERVFPDEHEVISVQEVQRRETAAGFEDLLPLPTTASTQTIDNFKSYPDHEWALPNNFPVDHQPDAPDTPSAQPSPIQSAQSVPASRASSAPSGEDTDEDEGAVGVSALVGRSLNVPVKKQVHWDGPPTPPDVEDSESQSESSSTTATAPAPQTSRSRKRPATDLDGTAEDTASASTTNRRATKAPRLKLKNTRKPQTAPQDEDDDDEEEEEEEEDDHIEAIIAGTRLPTNRASALRASRTRRARVGDQQPEFFTPEDFPDDGQVRCVCGIVENDEMPMTACEGCDVWQHIACVGPAYYDGMGDYFCQMCDPFVHRELIARLRRGEG